jgi:hypothetical protein
VTERDANHHRQFPLGDPNFISPIYAMPGRPPACQFSIEAGPLGVSELDDLKWKRGNVYDMQCRVPERSYERQQEDEHEAEQRWIQALRVYVKFGHPLGGSECAVFSQYTTAGRAAAVFASVTELDSATTQPNDQTKRNRFKWAIFQFVSFS